MTPASASIIDVSELFQMLLQLDFHMRKYHIYTIRHMNQSSSIYWISPFLRIRHLGYIIGTYIKIKNSYNYIKSLILSILPLDISLRYCSSEFLRSIHTALVEQRATTRRSYINHWRIVKFEMIPTFYVTQTAPLVYRHFRSQACVWMGL